MAVELIAKIKPKNNGDFMLVDSVDVEMADGRNLEETLENFSGGTTLIVNGEETSDYQLVIDTDSTIILPENENAFLTQIQQMFAGFQQIIDQQNEKIIELEGRISALELLVPNRDEEVIEGIGDYEGYSLIGYDGEVLVDYDYEEVVIVEGQVLDYQGYSLVDYTGYSLVDYNS
jgi:hypothetical protein